MKILVIGDSCIDTFVYCHIDRLCPEAPVPVLQPGYKSTNPGMAGNVAANLEALGAEVDLLTNSEMIEKTRYVDIKSGQMIMRLDDNDECEEYEGVFETVDYDAIVISDYNKSSVDSVAAVGRQISGRAKRGAAAGAGAQDKFVEKYTYEMGDEHVNALFEGEGLEEEFKFKAKTIFEAAVNDRVSEIQNELQESYSEWADLKVEKIRDGLVERVDSYLNYVIKEWMEENKLALESGIQNEINESFVNGIKTLFETHNINFPDTQMNVVEELETRVQAIEEEKQQLASYYDQKLNEELKNNISLNEEIEDLRRREIIREATDDIPLSQAERLENLAEGVDFVDEDSFARSMETLKENYFNRKAAQSPIVDDLRVLKEEIVAEEADNPIDLSESMQAYSKALTRYGKD